MRSATTSISALTRSLAAASPRAMTVQAAAVCGVAVLTAAAAHVRIPLPFSPVPITLQTLVVLLAGIVMGAGRGAASQVLYLGLGLVGLPVFAAGAGALLGPTGGYLVGFVAAAAVAGAIARRRSDAVGVAVAFCAGTLVVYACGTAWLCAVTGQHVAQALALGALPFLAGDALKLVAAVGLARVMVPAWRHVSGK